MGRRQRRKKPANYKKLPKEQLLTIFRCLVVFLKDCLSWVSWLRCDKCAMLMCEGNNGGIWGWGRCTLWAIFLAFLKI